VVPRGVGASNVDALEVVAGDEVALARAGAPDDVVGAAIEEDAGQVVAGGALPGGVGADEIAGQLIPAAALEDHAGAGEAVDDDAAQRAVLVVGEHQAVGAGAGVAAVHLDERLPVVAGAALGPTVEGDGGGDRRQRGRQADRPVIAGVEAVVVVGVGEV